MEENVFLWGCWGGVLSPWVWGSLCPKRCEGVLGGGVCQGRFLFPSPGSSTSLGSW